MARYVEMLLRHWVRFAILLIIAPTALGAGYALYFKSYTGSASLWVETPTYVGSSITPALWNIYLTPAQNQADTLNELLSTGAFIDQIGDRLIKTGAVTDDASRRAVLSSINTHLLVTADGTHLVRLTFSSQHQALCTQLLSVTIKLFQERLIAAQIEQADLSTQFLTNQLTTAKAAVNSSQAALQKYLADHPGVRTETVPAAIPTDYDKLLAQVQKDQTDVAQIQATLDQVTYTGAVAQRVVETNTKLIDQPAITRTGLLGDNSSLKKAALVALACFTFGAAYLLLLVWADKTARDAREIDSRLQVPVLATVPRYNLLEPL